MDAISAQFASLPHQDPKADNQTLFQYIKTRPEFDQTQYDPQFGSISAHFKGGGQTLVIVNNRPYSDYSASSKAAKLPPVALHAGSRAANQLGTGKNAVIFNNFGKLTDIPLKIQSSAVLDTIKTVLTSVGYSVTRSDGTLDALEHSVKNEDIVHVEGHGTFARVYNKDGSSGSPVYCLPTATGLNLVDEALHSAELQEGFIGPSLTADIVGNSFGLNKQYYITPKFAAKNWTLNNNCFVYFNTCMSNSNIEGTPFRQVCTKPPGGTYAGWTDLIRAGDSAQSAQYLYNSLAGQNNLGTLAKNPPQRAFDWPAVLKDMQNQHLNEARGPDLISPTAFLAFSTSAGTTKADSDSFGLFAPSISNVAVDEIRNQLVLFGEFGSDPQGGGTVTVGGAALSIRPGGWTQSEITCDGLSPGLSGDVVVTVRGHPSNAVPLTMWKGQIHLLVEHLNWGSENYKVNWNLTFRGDVHGWRYAPGQAVTYPYAPAASGETDSIQIGLEGRDSTADYEAGGTSDSDTRRIDLSGSGSIPFSLINPFPDDQGGFSAYMNVDLKGHKMYISANAAMWKGIAVTALFKGAPPLFPPSTIHDTADLTTVGGINNQYFDNNANARSHLPIVLSLDDNLNGQGGTQVSMVNNIRYTYTWSGFTAVNAPTAATTRSAAVHKRP